MQLGVWIGGSAPTGAVAPSVAMTTDKNAMAILAEAGITEDVAMIGVSGVNMTWANFILYEPEFKFLKGKSLHSYKYIADLGVFVPIGETYFGTYGANFLVRPHAKKKGQANDFTYGSKNGYSGFLYRVV